MFGKTPSDKDDCPLWQAPCREHRCRWYKHIIGKHPQTDQSIDAYDCAIAWLPLLVIESSQRSHQAGASVDKVANEIRSFHDNMVTLNRGGPQPKQLK